MAEEFVLSAAMNSPVMVKRFRRKVLSSAGKLLSELSDESSGGVTMCANTLEDLLVDGLKHAYYAEQQLVDATEELANGTSADEAASAFSEHHDETQTHVERIEDIFDTMGESPETETDHAVDGLVENHEEFVSKDPDQHVLDRYNITAGQMSEHYEIAMYGNLIPLADQLGMDRVADTLEQNLREEQDALDELSEIGEEFDYGQIQSE